jgi:hypothetical protein
MPNRSRVPLRLALVLGVAASLALSSLALAAETNLTADLAGVTEGENPGDADGSGTAAIVIDPAAGTACWTLEVADIEPVTQSHIHVGAAGESGDVVVPLDVDGFDGSSEGCTEGQDADALQAIIDEPAGYYVNIHTADYPAGAIRGQLVEGQPNTALPAPEGPLAALGALVLGLAAAIVLRSRRPLVVRD